MEYVLDVAKWRCGGTRENQLGVGNTAMCNAEGYMCCLGQFSLQKGVVYENDFWMSEPSDLVGRYPSYDENFVTADHADTDLAKMLMFTNDDADTTPKKKIDLIRSRLEEHGHSLTVINEDIL